MRASTRFAAGWLGVAAALACCGALAQARPATISLLPPQPAAGDLVLLRHDIPACLSEHVSVETLGPMSVRVTLSRSDTCDARLPPRTVTHELGRFAAGAVEIAYVECNGFPPPPLPLCRARGSELLVVGGGPPRSVPAWSTLAGALLALSLTLIGFGRLRRCRS
ncbi:MAG TPA: hypothetical protein VFZ93_15480 [Albitalea sp.]